MRIVEINGGLGNQVFEYIFSRYLEIVDGYEDVMLDTIHYSIHNNHNGFVLDLFPNAKLNLLCDNFDKDVWNNMVDIYIKSKIKHQIPYMFHDNGIDLLLVTDGYWHDKNGNLYDNKFEFNGTHSAVRVYDFYKTNEELIAQIKKYDSVYFKGVWLTNSYGNDIKKQIEHELKFPPLVHKENIEYCKLITSSEHSVGLHVRRGDFITVGKVFSASKYAKAIKDFKYSIIKANNPKPNFFIFSDDITWCKENIKQLGFSDKDNVTFIQGNDIDARNYIDMQLMTYCDCLIYNAFSSFCLAASMISEKNIKCICVS